MKNKKVIYYLLPVVLLLWSVILYRIYTGTSGQPKMHGYPSHASEKILGIPEKKEYSLLLNYSDPFTNHPSAVTKQRKSEVILNASVITDNKLLDHPSNYDWANVLYVGTIEHADKNYSIALLQIQGKSYMLSIGKKTSEGMQLLKITQDSVQLRVGKEKKYIRKLRSLNSY